MSVSASTVRRWLAEDAIRPWRYQSWIFPRDPNFAVKAARVLELYQRICDGARLGEDEYVISADEKSQLQALSRCHPGLTAGAGRVRRVEFEYNGSSHAGNTSITRMRAAWPTVTLVHLPVHASWLNQIEVVFSVLQRKVVKPADFADLDTLAQRLSDFEPRYNRAAMPFDWRFTRADLADLLRRIGAHRAEAMPASAV